MRDSDWVSLCKFPQAFRVYDEISLIHLSVSLLTTGMSIMMLHAITCPSENIPNIQDTLAKKQDDDPRDELFSIGVRMASNPIYKQRITDVCRDCIRYNYI